jgi:4-diphosphocytidyl-2-C-methyl-D-erythritol kinase
MKIKSFAKINLGLEVIRKREDNYHEIVTLFQSINLYDVLEFLPERTPEIHLKGNDKSIPWEKDNLIFKAALLLKEKYEVNEGIEIIATKNIPSGKGLAGGSSNAAMTLYALNKIWGLRLKKEELQELGKKLGADAPFFLEGGLCLGRGRGDEISPLLDIPPLYCLLVFPPFPISTATIYGHLRLSLTSGLKDSKITQFLANREFGFLENRLEETIFSLYPQVQEIKSFFQSQGPELSLVSGSGSAVFGLFKDREKAEKGLKEFQKTFSAVLVETLSRESYWQRLSAGE